MLVRARANAPRFLGAFLTGLVGLACLSSNVSEIKLVFGIPPERPTPNIAPSWNGAPIDPLPVVHYDTSDHEAAASALGTLVYRGNRRNACMRF
jgi:hypothetical protein